MFPLMQKKKKKKKKKIKNGDTNTAMTDLQ